ncbi:Dna2/Cas4 domain-containing protein, partial [Klebsiella pneumoniae]|nr:Dna2/Cas4 domain-containing protein [Klebsiella pneumoniae]
YLKILKEKGIIRKGKLEFVEKNKKDKKILIYELTEDIEKELDIYIKEIEDLILSDNMPPVLNKPKCKKC